MTTRTQRSAWNMGSGFVLSALTMVTGFVSTPFILHWLGAEPFGAYRVLFDWFQWLQILDLGVVGAVQARLAPKLGTGDEKGAFGVLASGFRVYVWIATAMFVLGAVLVLGLPHAIALHTITANELRLSAWIMLIPVAWLPFSVFRALTEASQRGYIVNFLLTVQALSTTALLVLTAWAGWGLLGQAVGTTIALAPLTIVLVFQGLRRYPGVLKAKPDPQAMHEVRSLNWPTFWFNVSSRLGLLSDNIVIGWTLGPTVVASFFLTQRLAQIAQLQLQAIGNATWAGLVELHAQGHKERFRTRLIELTALVSSLGIAVLGPIAAYNGHFIRLWVGSGSYAGEWVNGIACVNIWIWAIISLWLWPVSGAGHIGEWLPYALTFSAINITVSIGATLLIGIQGPLIGTLVAFLAIHAWALPRVLGKLFDPSLASIWKPALKPLIWGVPYSALLWYVARAHTPYGWVGLGAEASLAVLGGLGFWWLSLGSDLRQEWQFRLRSALAL